MAVLKYKNENGQFVTLTNYAVQPITPVQTTGTSTTDIMSQRAVSDEVNKKVNNDDLNGKIANAISSDNAVKDAVADVVKDAPAISGAISSVVDTKLTAYTTTSVADERYAFKTHTHNASDISDFNEAVSTAVSSDASVSGVVKNVVEKYIYGDTTPSQSSSVVTTDNLNTTLASYVKDDEINGLVSQAIATDATVAKKFGHVVYDSTNKRINFYANSSSTSVIEYIDATGFVKDGMVSNVEISGGNLVITFNSDSGKEAISIPVTSIFNPNNYYTKSETSGKTEIANALNGKANSTHNHASSAITTMAGYSKPSATSAIKTSDTLNVAIGKLEYKIDTAVAGGVSSVSLGSGSTNGSITLSVNGTLQNTITVPWSWWCSIS